MSVIQLMKRGLRAFQDHIIAPLCRQGYGSLRWTVKSVYHLCAKPVYRKVRDEMWYRDQEGVVPLRRQVGALQEHVTPLQHGLAQLMEHVAFLQQQVASLQQDGVAPLQQQVTPLHQQMPQILQKGHQLQQQVAQLQQQVAPLQQQMALLQQQVGTLEASCRDCRTEVGRMNRIYLDYHVLITQQVGDELARLGRRHETAASPELSLAAN